MQFLVVGLDGDDDKAQDRRMAVRGAHIALGDELVASGNIWFGAAILRSNGTMGGSAFFVDFEDEKDLQNWLDREPYVIGDVWRTVTVHRCSTRDPWQFNRPR